MNNFMFHVKQFKKVSGVFIVNFEHISHLVLVFLLLTLNMQMPAGSNATLRYPRYAPALCYDNTRH